MKMTMTGKYTSITKHKVVMENGIPKLDKNGKQVLTGEVEYVDDFDNQITLSGLNQLGYGNPIDYICLSGDTAEPTKDNATMSGVLAIAKASLSTSYDPVVDLVAKTAKSKILYRAEFAAGAGTGNITKTGAGWGTSSSFNLFSSALVKDSNDNNTVITKLADEILKISYTLTIVFSLADSVSTVSISGENYTVTTRVANVNYLKLSQFNATMFNYPTVVASTSPIKTVSEQPDGTNYTSDKGAVINYDYVNGSMQKRYSFNFATNEGNYPNGIKSFFISPFNTVYLQIGFSHSVTGVGIPKKSTEKLAIESLYVSWGLADATTT